MVEVKDVSGKKLIYKRWKVFIGLIVFVVVITALNIFVMNRNISYDKSEITMKEDKNVTLERLFWT